MEFLAFAPALLYLDVLLSPVAWFVQRRAGKEGSRDLENAA